MMTDIAEETSTIGEKFAVKNKCKTRNNIMTITRLKKV